MNRRRRRVSDHGGPNHERWLISYGDFITLLFAFFVVMYASSHSDQKKAVALSRAIESAFSQMGMFTPASAQLNLIPSPLIEANTLAKQLPLEALQAKLQTELKPEIARGAVSLHLTRQGLVIRLEELGFFDSGSAQIRLDALPVLARIATTVAPLPNALRIEGYTDNVPIHTAQFASNWQLSTARATELVRLFISQYHVDPVRLAASGYAQYHPIASNATAAGRQMNRRVDLVVVSEKDRPPPPTTANPSPK
ncbi:MAG: flagellar motor protein MotB [Terriglobales bacterium]